MRLFSPILLFLTLLSISPSLAANKEHPPKPPSKNAVLLSRIRSLTLRANTQTKHRRVPSVPELTCTGPGCDYYEVDIMRCKNTGSSYSNEDVEWTCSASLPEEFKLGSTEVTCEGYDSRDDRFVLKGSCGVEYRLLLTDKGEEKYGRPGSWSGSAASRKVKPDNGRGNGRSRGEGWTFSSILFVCVFVGVFAWIIYSMYRALPPANRLPRLPRGGLGGGWGGGGGGPDDPWDPPPPYPGKRSNFGRQQEGWRPGFWSGALGGAAAGYAAGQRVNRRPSPPPPQRNAGWFGEDSTAPRRTSSNGSSSARHESTGFGSTSRR